MLRYEFINPENLNVDKLEEGKQYTTKVIDAQYSENGDFIIQLEFIGEEYVRDDPDKNCLFPIAKDSTNEPSYYF